MKALQRLRGTRLCHFFGVGQCSVEDPDFDPDAFELRLLPVFDVDDVSDEREVWDFVVLEFMHNGSLKKYIRRKRDRADAAMARKRRASGGKDEKGWSEGKLSEAAAASVAALWPWHDRLLVVRDVCEGMVQIHRKQFVHRDLKSDNVLVDKNGRCKPVTF